jgi:hypothetical protein
MDPSEARRQQIERLSAPIPWRPAPQIGDASYRLPKPVLRKLIETAQGTRRG